jgi:hypothetical protein
VLKSDEKCVDCSQELCVTGHANKVLLERFSVQPSIVHLALKPYIGLSLKNVMEGDETSMKHGKLFCLSPGDALRYLGVEVIRIFTVREGETRLC